MIYKFYLPSKYQLKGFEIELAKLEIKGLFDPKQIRKKGSLFEIVVDRKISNKKIKKLTFIEKVCLTPGEEINPIQNTLDKAAYLSRNGENYNNDLILKYVEVAKREHNYLSHNFHSYKGKYFPQLVNSLINLANLKEGSLVLDPFNGSGTTTLEACLHNYKSLGFDLSPIATLIARSKTDLLFVKSDTLNESKKKLFETLTSNFTREGLKDTYLLGIEHGLTERNYPEETDLPNFNYLKNWFPLGNLKKIALIINAIKPLKNQRFKNIALTALSDIVKKYSYQDPKQIRVGKRKDNPPSKDLLYNYHLKFDKVIKEKEVFERIKESIAWKGYEPEIETVDITVSSNSEMGKRHLGNVDMIVTSPPYAAALPYIDTDRLSLFLLGLMTTSNRKEIENQMIGNREITERERVKLEKEMLENKGLSKLPNSVIESLKKIRRINNLEKVGFRKKNKAAVLYKYFRLMDKSFSEMYKFLKSGGLYAIVIGNSKTTAGKSTEIDIQTDKLLIDIAKRKGFKLIHKMPMTDQPMYMIHSKNAIDTETIFILQK